MIPGTEPSPSGSLTGRGLNPSGPRPLNCSEVLANLDWPMTYEFCLVCEVPVETDLDRLVDLLFESGCADALPGAGRTNVIGLNFAQAGVSKAAVMANARAAVEAAIPEATVIYSRRSRLTGW
jgi:hypothetical protein